MNCPNCGSTKMFIYQEKYLTKRLGINEHDEPVEVAGSDYVDLVTDCVQCSACNHGYTYELNHAGKITNLRPAEESIQ